MRNTILIIGLIACASFGSDPDSGKPFGAGPRYFFNSYTGGHFLWSDTMFLTVGRTFFYKIDLISSYTGEWTSGGNPDYKIWFINPNGSLLQHYENYFINDVLAVTLKNPLESTIYMVFGKSYVDWSAKVIIKENINNTNTTKIFEYLSKNPIDTLKLKVGQKVTLAMKEFKYMPRDTGWFDVSVDEWVSNYGTNLNKKTPGGYLEVISNIACIGEIKGIYFTDTASIIVVIEDPVSVKKFGSYPDGTSKTNPKSYNLMGRRLDTFLKHGIFLYQKKLHIGYSNISN